jgi:hypothetical protein
MIARELCSSHASGSRNSPVNLNSIVRGAMTLLQYTKNILVKLGLAEARCAG